METWVVVLIVIAVIALIIWGIVSMVHVLQEYERGVVFRLGRVRGRAKGPGLIILLPFGIDRMRKVTIQTVAMNVPPQDVITKDNVTMRVDAVVYARVEEPVPAVVKVQNYLFAVSQSAQTNLRAILGKYDLDTLLSERESINRELHGIIARVTHEWGVQVLSVEVKDVDLPDDLRRAMAREAEADREARALMISADAERRASRLLSDAAAILSQNPAGHADPLPPDGRRRGHRAELDPGHADPDRAAEPDRAFQRRRPRQRDPASPPAGGPAAALVPGLAGTRGGAPARAGQRPPRLVPFTPG